MTTIYGKVLAKVLAADGASLLHPAVWADATTWWVDATVEALGGTVADIEQWKIKARMFDAFHTSDVWVDTSEVTVDGGAPTMHSEAEVRAWKAEAEAYDSGLKDTTDE